METQVKILVVDDNRNNVRLLKKQLESFGYYILVAYDGMEAIEKITTEKPDLIVSDILMPRMDGFQLCRECKKDESLKKIPFIFYTATYTDEKSRKLALDIGAIEYIIKPQEPDVFVKIINKIWDKYSKGEIKPTKKPLEEKVYMKTYNERLIQKLEKKMLDLEKSEKRIKYLYSVLGAIRGVNQLIVKEKDRGILIQKTCDVLIKARGYNTAWLGFLKDEKTFAMVVGSPLGADVSRFCAQVLRGDHPPCIKKALTKKDLFIFMDRSRDCGDCSLCSLKKPHLGRNSLLIRIAHKSKLFGFLVLSLEPDVYIDQEEKGLLEEVTGDIAFGLYSIELEENLNKRTNELKERVKELNCLWEISNLVEKPDISLEAIIKGTVNLLPSTWQYPEITCARIIFKAKEYKSKNFKETTWKQSSDIMVHQKPVGTVVVYYLEERPQRDEGPFLKEERKLINIIAERLGEIIERKQSEEEQRLHAVMMHNVAEGVYLIGLDDLRIKWTNERFTRMFGYDPGEMIGKKVDILNAPTKSTPAETRISIVDILKKTGEWHGEVENIKRDGTHFWCYANVSLFDHPEYGKIMVSAHTDITERKQAEQKLLQSHNKLLKTMEDTIYTIGKVAETRDPYTAGHQKNVSQIATFIAREMKLPKDKIEGIRIASLVHDIGKISIPSEILNKPTKLSEIEYSLIKDHSQVSYDVLKSIEFPWPIAKIVLQHHERLDGSGYPNKLKGDEIILEAKIIAVADVVEAMSSHRPYRPALGIDKALEEISKNKGTLYDSEVVDVCIELFKEKGFKFK